MAMLKNKTLWFYIGLASAVFALATILWGLIDPSFARKTFDTMVIVFLGLGIAAEVANVFVGLKVMPLVPVIFYSVGLAFILYDGMPVIMDIINKVNFLDGKPMNVIGYIVLTVIACALAAISCFNEQRKEEA